MQVPEKYKFIIELGKVLHTYGVPSYKSQIYLTEIASKKGIEANFMDTPTWVNYVFFEEDDHTYNYVECVPPGELNLGALSRIEELTNKLLENKISFEEAKAGIEKIKVKPISYGKITEMLAFMFSAGSFSLILNAGLTSAIVAFIIGAVVYGITLLAQKSGYVRSTLESLVAFIATIITGLLSLYFDQINISMTILASIIVFIPGLAITTALEEITSRSLVSGTAKLFDALISLFKQFFGVVMGLVLLPLFVDLQPNVVINDVPEWVDHIAIFLLAISLTPILKVRPKDVLYSVLAGLICYFTTTLFEFAGLLVSIFIGTVVAVLISKVFGKLTRSPELIFLVPGTIMLVPGSKAFISLSSVFIDSTNTYSNMGEQVLYIFMGIIGGLIFSGSFMDVNITKASTQSINFSNSKNT